MKNKLITALRTAATALEQKTFSYDWAEANQCNAGIVICALTGKTSAELGEITEAKDITLWEEFVGTHCPVTGIPKNKLLRELYSHGLTGVDIVHPENLSDPRVLARMNLGTETKVRIVKSFLRAKKVQEEVPIKCEMDNKEHLIAYLRAWADILVEEGKDDVPEPMRKQEFSAAGSC